jgi:N-ethylmaleimide reductase
MSELLFSTYQLGTSTLRNRVVMAPMTRNRSPLNVPAAIVAEYYAQRAEAGLLITEGTSPSPNGVGLPQIPGLFNDAQFGAWALVTEAVHKQAGRILLQVMHTGRAGHCDNLPPRACVLGPSPIAAPDLIWTEVGKQPHPVPREMDAADIERALDEFTNCAELAMKAGFDGVELHAGNGLLVDQFLNTASNQRLDAWGGSVEGRIRFAVEVARRVTQAIGAQRVGMRISPYGAYNGMVADAAMDEVFLALAAKLDQLDLAHLHLVDLSSMGGPKVKPEIKTGIRRMFRNTLILSGGYTRELAEAELISKQADLIAFGRPFIANPRLVSLMRRGGKLQPFDEATLYTPGAAGYTDYPLLD